MGIKDWKLNSILQVLHWLNFHSLESDSTSKHLESVCMYAASLITTINILFADRLIMKIHYVDCNE